MELFDQVRAAPPPDRIRDIKPPTDVENGSQDGNDNDDDDMKDIRMPSPMAATPSPDFTLDKYRNKDKEMDKSKGNAPQPEESELSGGDAGPEGSFKALKRKISQDSMVVDHSTTDKNKIEIKTASDTELDDQPQQSSPPKTKAEQKMFIDHQPESKKNSTIVSLKTTTSTRTCLVRIKRLSQWDIDLYTSKSSSTSGNNENYRKRGRPRKNEQENADLSPTPRKKSKTSPKIHIKVPLLQNGSKQRPIHKSNRGHTPPPSKLNKLIKRKGVFKNHPTVSTALIKRFGKRFFSCVVKLNRFPMPWPPVHVSTPLNNSTSSSSTKRRSRKSNLSVSFSEAVEIFGSSESGTRGSTLGSGRSPRKSSVSVPTRLQRVDATGNILEDISLTSSSSKRVRRSSGGNNKSETCNGGDSSSRKLKRSSLRVPVTGLASLRLEDKCKSKTDSEDDANDDDDDDDEYIVPNELPGIHRAGTPVARPLRKRVSITTTTISDDDDDDDDDEDDEEGEANSVLLAQKTEYKNLKKKKEEKKVQEKEKKSKEDEDEEEDEQTKEEEENTRIRVMKIKEKEKSEMKDKTAVEEKKSEEDEKAEKEKNTKQEEKKEQTNERTEINEKIPLEEERSEENKKAEEDAKAEENEKTEEDEKTEEQEKVKEDISEKKEKEQRVESEEREDAKQKKEKEREDATAEKKDEKEEDKKEKNEEDEEPEEEKRPETEEENIDETVEEWKEDKKQEEEKKEETKELSETDNEEEIREKDSETIKYDSDKKESKDLKQKSMEIEDIEETSDDGVSNMEPLMVSQTDILSNEDDEIDSHKEDQSPKDNDTNKTNTESSKISPLYFLNSNKLEDPDDILEIETSLDDVRDLHTPLSNNSRCSTPQSKDLPKKIVHQLRSRLDSGDSDSSFKSASEMEIAASTIVDIPSMNSPLAANNKTTITTTATSQLNKSPAATTIIENSEPQCSSTVSIPTPPFSGLGVMPNLDVLEQLTESNFQLNNSRHTITTGTLDDIMTALES